MFTGLGILGFLLAAHYVCDYPLQGDWLSKAKNPTLWLTDRGLVRHPSRTEQLASVAQYGEVIWPSALLGHAAIHAAAVQLITGSWVLGGIEFVAHTVIDYLKCKGYFGYNIDQHLHVACKVIYVAVLIISGGTLV